MENNVWGHLSPWCQTTGVFTVSFLHVSQFFPRKSGDNISSIVIYELQGILINGQFPGPHIDAVTNDNIIISVFNYLREPFLISW